MIEALARLIAQAALPTKTRRSTLTATAKVKPTPTQRVAFVYIRPSTPSQVEHHRESTARQYALVHRARELGGVNAHVTVIDEDLGLSGARLAKRSGFARLTAEVALGRGGSSSGSKSPAWPVVMLTGTGSSTSAA